MNPKGAGTSSFLINSAILMKRFSLALQETEVFILLEPRNSIKRDSLLSFILVLNDNSVNPFLTYDVFDAYGRWVW